MRVVVVDSCPVFREGLKSVMHGMQDLDVVCEASDSRDVQDEVIKESDLLIVDGGVEALNLLRQLDKKRRPGQPPFVLVLSAQMDSLQASQMLAAGADGYLSKQTPLQPMLQAISRVGAGRRHFGSEVKDRLVKEDSGQPKRLSGREYEVLCLLCSGLRAVEVAARLTLSVKTVSTYRSRVLAKLQLRNTPELIRYAYKTGIVS